MDFLSSLEEYGKIYTSYKIYYEIKKGDIEMKKLFSVVVSVVMILSLCACGGKQDDSSVSSSETNMDDTSEHSGISVDKSLLSVEITMPSTFFEESSDEEIEDAANERGIEKCIINDDGSVTYKMSKAKHKELLDDLKSGVEESIDSMLHGEDAVESFQEIEYNDDLSKFNVYVDQETYTEWDSFASLSLFFIGAYYQTFAGEDIDKLDVIVNYIDASTNETIESGSYRNFVNNMENTDAGN